MADWTVYTHDAAANLAAASVTDSVSSGTAPNAVDIDQTTRWQPGSTTGIITFNLGAARTVIGCAIGNHNIAYSNTVLVWEWDANGVAPYTTNRNILGVGTVNDFLMLNTDGTPVSAQYWRLTVSGAPANISIGTISVLTDWGTEVDGDANNGGGYSKIALSPLGPAYPIAYGYDTGFASFVIGSGTEVVQRIADPVMSLALNPAYMSATTRQFIELSWRRRTYGNNPGWMNGVWVTPDTWSDSPTPAAITDTHRAYYMRPVAGSGLSMSISAAGSRTDASIMLSELRRA